MVDVVAVVFFLEELFLSLERKKNICLSIAFGLQRILMESFGEKTETKSRNYSNERSRGKKWLKLFY